METVALTINLLLAGVYTLLLGVASVHEANQGKEVSEDLKTAA